SAEQGLEGIVAKRLDSTYQPGRRTTSWLKVKNFGRQEFVIGGWMPGKGRRSERIGALLLGVHERGGRLRYAGRVGTGFSEQELERLGRLLAGLRRESSPFAAGGQPPRGAIFCEPKLVAEIESREWTRGGSLRQPSYKGLREDKAPEEVVREDEAPEEVVRQDGRRQDERQDETQRARPAPLSRREQSPKKAVAVVEGHELKLSNRAKVLYPESGFTKGDVIDYYAAAAAVLTEHLEGRPLTVKRWPDGVEGSSFFQKQAPA